MPMYMGRKIDHKQRGLTMLVGQAWEVGDDTWKIANVLDREEAEIERHLHLYLHWKRVNHPALRGVLWQTGDNDAKHNDKAQTRPEAVGKAGDQLPAILLPKAPPHA